MERLARNVPLPPEMQGSWMGKDDPPFRLVVCGGEVVCFGRTVEYDYKLIEQMDGALTVSLKIQDEAGEDAFQRNNITGLVLTPEGELHVYNVKFACMMVRAEP